MTADLSQTFPQARLSPTSKVVTPAGTKTAQPTTFFATPNHDASAEPSHLDGQSSPQAAEGNDHPTAIPRATTSSETLSDADDPRAAMKVATPLVPTPPGGLLAAAHAAIEADPAFLALMADIVGDLEVVRIANRNRYGQLTRSGPDKDGVVRGLGLDLLNPYVAQVAEVLAEVESAERRAVRSLEKLMRSHPLYPWVKAQRGLGEKTVARLLGAIGDPYLRPELVRADGTVEPARPRMVSELWAYCGLHVLPARQTTSGTQEGYAGGGKTGHPGHNWVDNQKSNAGVAPKRQRGQKANWSTAAKTRAYLVAEACVKTLRKPCAVDPDLRYAIHADGCACSPFRLIYDEAKAKYTGAVHEVACVRCGPAGAPAEPGSPISDAHRHARAMRAVSKELLKELWRESKRLHDQAASTAGGRQ